MGSQEATAWGVRNGDTSAVWPSTPHFSHVVGGGKVGSLLRKKRSDRGVRIKAKRRYLRSPWSQGTAGCRVGPVGEGGYIEYPPLMTFPRVYLKG
jgi:hypothetical protein